MGVTTSGVFAKGISKTVAKVEVFVIHLTWVVLPIG